MLKIVTIPDPILSNKTSLVKNFNQSLADLVSKMIETCRLANGIGLAAPQIGKSIRLCIINLEHQGLPAFALVNPKIVKKSWKKVEMEEGCLSIPGIFGIVKRPAKITVEALNLQGEKNKFEAAQIHIWKQFAILWDLFVILEFGQPFRLAQRRNDAR